MKHAIAVLATVGVTVVAAQTRVAGDTTHCDEIAARLRANPGLVDGTAPTTSPLQVLTWGRRRCIELANAVLDESLSAKTFEARFQSMFSPSPALRQRVSHFMVGGRSELFSLAESDLHTIIQTSGTMVCQSFIFFRSIQGREAMTVPTVARQGRDCGGEAGHLARVGTDAAFLEVSEDSMDETYDFRVVPWRNGEWLGACSVDMAFHLTHRVSDVFVPDSGPLNADQIRSLMPGVTQQWKALREAEGFHIGPVVPSTQQATLERLRAAGIRTAGTEAAFGGDPLSGRLVVSGFATLSAAGQIYLVQLGHPHVGWREFPEILAVVLRLKDSTGSELEAVASAVIEQARGPLDFIRVRAER